MIGLRGFSNAPSVLLAEPLRKEARNHQVWNYVAETIPTSEAYSIVYVGIVDDMVTEPFPRYLVQLRHIPVPSSFSDMEREAFRFCNSARSFSF
jgi:hypothetical protein